MPHVYDLVGSSSSSSSSSSSFSFSFSSYVQGEGLGVSVMTAYVEIVFDNADSRIPVSLRHAALSPLLPFSRVHPPHPVPHPSRVHPVPN